MSTACEKMTSAPSIYRNLTQDSESWPNGMQLFNLMGHYITAVCTVNIINGGVESNNNILGCVLLREAGVLENDRVHINTAGSSLK